MSAASHLDRYAVLGNPVAHSRSPFIHSLFAQQTGEALAYVRLLCPLAGFAATVRAFADAGGRGCNVTVPFKFEAPTLAAHCTERARLAGAANVLRLDAGGWWADNSDGVGLVRDIEDGAGVALANQRVLLIGAGGGSAGVLGPLLAARPAAVVVANRTLAKAQALVGRHAEVAGAHGVTLTARPLDDAGEHFDIVLNASASSLAGQESPVQAAVLAPGALAVTEVVRMSLMLGVEKAQGRVLSQSASRFAVASLYDRCVGFFSMLLVGGIATSFVLVGGLRDGRIEACILDGAEVNFTGEGSPLNGLKNLFITPRLGSHTREARLRSSWYVAYRMHEAISADQRGVEYVPSASLDIELPGAVSPSQWGEQGAMIR